MDGKHLSRRQNVKKILLLSRVTIGADVAITSIIIQRLANLFPDAEIVLIGGSKLDEIYGGNSRLLCRYLDAFFQDRVVLQSFCKTRDCWGRLKRIAHLRHIIPSQKEAAKMDVISQVSFI